MNIKTIGLFVAGALICFPLASSADPTVDFSIGPGGDLGTTHTVVDGIDVTSFGGNIFQWVGGEPYACCPGIHGSEGDQGFGVSPAGATPNAATSELNPGEAFRLYNGTGLTWTHFWFSSVNNNSFVKVFLSDGLPVGLTFIVYNLGNDPTKFDQRIEIPQAAQHFNTAWFIPDTYTHDNYTNLWGVDLAREPVPEPASLTLLGMGLVGGAWSLRKRGRP